MYSLTFGVRFLLPERHQWKARIPDCRSNVENAPRRRPVADGPAAPACRMRRAVFGARPVAPGRRQATSVRLRASPAAPATLAGDKRRRLATHERRRLATRADPAQPAVRTMSSYRGMDASLKLGFALCCHSNATRAPIANPRNSAQLEGSLYRAPKLHPSPCSSVGVRPRTDTQTDSHTDRQTHRRA